MHPLRIILRRWAHQHEFAVTFAELDSYTDRLLRDMGILRDDIAAIAHAEAERRVAPTVRHNPQPNASWQTLAATPGH